MHGQTLGGSYQVIKQIGQGGFGVTFLAVDMQRVRNPQCIVKQLKPVASDPYTLREAKRLFDQEAQTLEELGNHDQIQDLHLHVSASLCLPFFPLPRLE